MIFATLAKQLRIPQRTLEKQSLAAFIGQRILEVESELIELAAKYGVKNTAGLLRAARRGHVADTTDTIEDTFRLDYLETERKQLQNIKRQL